MSSTFAIDVPNSLLSRVRAGDRRAFEQLYRLFERPVYGLAWRMLHDVEDAREAVQDTLLTVYDKLDQFRAEAPFWSWLRQIAVNTCLMRQRKRHPEMESDHPLLDHDAVVPALSDWQSGDLERVLRALNPQTRSVVWLYFVEGLTHEEIAESFGKSVSFSKSQVSRGLVRLREALNPASEGYAYA